MYDAGAAPAMKHWRPRDIVSRAPGFGFIVAAALTLGTWQAQQAWADAGASLESEQAFVELLESLESDPEARAALRTDLESRITAYQRSLELLDALEAAPAAEEAPEPEAAHAAAERPAEAVPALDTDIDFNRDIRPILSNNCFTCHGPDPATRAAGLRLDERDPALMALSSGARAIIPGDRAASALYQRITAQDPLDRMPPPSEGKVLDAAAIELLGRWIDDGAPYAAHWAFIPPERPEVPDAGADWARNPIDRFLAAEMAAADVKPSPEASPHALVRRATLDVTGLPPTLEEVEQFVNDTEPGAYERLLDRLFASPHHGEHMARHWLDIARYGDTNGYHIDNERYMWRWRDWVIDAFNANMPFDQFTVEQLAGDLLPSPSRDQLIATGFNRNHMINFEGGAIPEEYHANYVLDRVHTVSTAWMGLTMSCAQCHDHKYDPLSMAEFYSFYAFFNNIDEKGLDGVTGNAEPLIQAPLPHQERTMGLIRANLARLDEAMHAPLEAFDARQAEWEAEQGRLLAERWTPVALSGFGSEGGASFTQEDGGTVLIESENTGGAVYRLSGSIPGAGHTAIRLDFLPAASVAEEDEAGAESLSFTLGEMRIEAAPKGDPEAFADIAIATVNTDRLEDRLEAQKAINGDPGAGWAIQGGAGGRSAVFVASAPFGFEEGALLRLHLHDGREREHAPLARIRVSVSQDPDLAPATLSPWQMSGPYLAEDGAAAHATAFEPERHVDLAARYPDQRAKWTAHPHWKDGVVHPLTGGPAVTYLYRTITAPTAREMTLSLGSGDGLKLWVNGRLALERDVRRNAAPDQDQAVLRLNAGENALLMKVVNHGGDHAFYFRRAHEDAGAVPMHLEAALQAPAHSRNAEAQRALRSLYRARHWAEWPRLEQDYLAYRERERTLDAEIPTTMIMREREEPRPTFILERGQYDLHGEEVHAGVPSALPPLPEGAPANRLGLAEWLVAPDHPLTARVVVNRLWSQFFGIGIVKTVEDFGAQGDWPSHPELLDWLAREFIESGWDLRHMQRLILSSAAYRQSAAHRPEIREQDPENRLLARGPRFRMDAEMVRDVALAASGLLAPRIGGPSVYPYQPPGLWEEVAYGAGYTAQRYVQGSGEELHRRSMYTFWKRQSPPPLMMLFDAPNREVCMVHRERTNTPLQALALMNSPQFVEAARRLAERAAAEMGGKPAESIAHAFALATGRTPSPAEMETLLEVYAAQLAAYEADSEAAAALLEVGESPRTENMPAATLAALSVVANLILNLDETITKG